jgi:hypothetical protein
MTTDPLPESARNELLRRVDWRFLLPLQTTRTAASFGGGSLGRGISLISEISGESGVDLAVLINPRLPALRAARASLRPGGAFYCEWYSPFAGGVHGVRRKLEAAGFSDIASYWPWPWPIRRAPLFWVPLEAPQALGHLMRMAPGVRRARRRLLRPILYALWRLGLRLGIVIPVCTIARRAGEVEAGAAAAAEERDRGLLDLIRIGWRSWGLGKQPEHLSLALFTPGQRSINKVIALVFADSNPEPAMIVKVARVPEAGRALEREWANLRSLQASGRPAGAPRPLFLDQCVGGVALGETVLSGKPLWALLDERTYRRLALAVTDWLADLASKQAVAPREAWWDRLVEPILTSFERSFGIASDLRDLACTRRVLLDLGELPLVLEHRDCSPWNVLVSEDGGIALPDWESAEPQGLPGLDLIYFLTYLAFFQDGAMRTGSFRDAYRATLDPSTSTGRVVAECEKRYAAEVGIDVAALGSLRLLVWLIHSRSEHDRLTANSDHRPAVDVLGDSLFLTLWREELERFRRMSVINS